MKKIFKNFFFAFLADILGYCSVYAIKQSFDLKIFVVDFFIIFLIFIIFDFSDYIDTKRSKNKDGDEHE